MQNLLRRLTIPLFLLCVGVVMLHLGYAWYKAAQFEYIPRDGPRQVISPLTNPAAFWTSTIALCVVGASLVVTSINVFFRFRRNSAPGLPREHRFGIIMFAMGLIVMFLALAAGQCSQR